MFGPEELRAAQGELADAYRLFNWSTDPRLIDEAIHRIRIAEMRVDYLTHEADRPADPAPLPWIAGADR